MNKTILIAGGAAVASLAVGTAGGYFVAKRRFEKKTSAEVAREVEATKKYYSVLLMQAKEQKPDSPRDVVITKEDLGEEGADDISPADRKALEQGLAKVRANRREKPAPREDAEQALVDYSGISTKATKKASPAKRATKAQPTTESDESGLEHHNIFADPPRTPKKALPPRDEVTGSFRRKTPREEEYDPPQIITAEDFLLNDPEHNQDSLYYFVNDKTLVLQADPSEPVDRNLIGEVNLTLFPVVADEEPSMIYVRNDVLSVDYEVQLMTESLTDFIGLGTEDDGDDDVGANWV